MYFDRKAGTQFFSMATARRLLKLPEAERQEAVDALMQRFRSNAKDSTTCLACGKVQKDVFGNECKCPRKGPTDWGVGTALCQACSNWHITKSKSRFLPTERPAKPLNWDRAKLVDMLKGDVLDKVYALPKEQRHQEVIRLMKTTQDAPACLACGDHAAHLNCGPKLWGLGRTICYKCRRWHVLDRRSALLPEERPAEPLNWNRKKLSVALKSGGFGRVCKLPKEQRQQEMLRIMNMQRRPVCLACGVTAAQIRMGPPSWGVAASLCRPCRRWHCFARKGAFLPKKRPEKPMMLARDEQTIKEHLKLGDADEEASNKEASDEEASDEEASDEEASDEEASDEEASDQEASDQEASDQEASDEEASDEEASDQEASDEEEALDQEASGSETEEQDSQHTNVASFVRNTLNFSGKTFTAAVYVLSTKIRHPRASPLGLGTVAGVSEAVVNMWIHRAKKHNLFSEKVN
jgi:hypothetical protein